MEQNGVLLFEPMGGGRMSVLIFHTLDAYLHEEYGRLSTETIDLLAGKVTPTAAPDRSSMIRINVTPDLETRVSLSTGENLRKLEGSLVLKPSDEARPIASEDKAKNQIGYISYGEEHQSDSHHIKPHYVLWALIPRAQFDYVGRVLRDSRMPMSIFINIEGFSHPDEFSLAWDTKTKAMLPMVSINFSIRAAHFPAIDWDDQQAVGQLMPVTRADLRSAVEAVSGLHAQIIARLNWMIVGMIALLGALVWRYW
jgi:hypothetical protein